jgi:hypothetical protein
MGGQHLLLLIFTHPAPAGQSQEAAVTDLFKFAVVFGGLMLSVLAIALIACLRGRR